MHASYLVAATSDAADPHERASRWHDRDVLRFSVSNALTDAQAVADTVAAVVRALARADSTVS